MSTRVSPSRLPDVLLHDQRLRDVVLGDEPAPDQQLAERLAPGGGRGLGSGATSAKSISRSVRGIRCRSRSEESLVLVPLRDGRRFVLASQFHLSPSALRWCLREREDGAESGSGWHRPSVVTVDEERLSSGGERIGEGGDLGVRDHLNRGGLLVHGLIRCCRLL